MIGRETSGRTPKKTAPTIGPQRVPIPPKTTMERITMDWPKPKFWGMIKVKK
jgi:hypothetical protein